MAIVLVMKMPIDQIVNMVSMGNRLMSAIGAMHVIGRVAATAVTTGTGGRIC